MNVYERKNVNEKLTIVDLLTSYPYLDICEKWFLEIALQSFIFKSVSVFTFEHLFKK